MAASNRISYNNTNTAAGGGHLALATRYVILAKQEIRRSLAIANEMTGGGVTAANLEGSTEFGAASGKGQALYDAINNFSANLNNLTDAALADLDTGQS